MTHQLVDHPGRDAVVVQPGREGVPVIMGAAQVQAEKVPLRPRPVDSSQVGVPQVEINRALGRHHGEVVMQRFEIKP